MAQNMSRGAYSVGWSIYRTRTRTRNRNRKIHVSIARPFADADLFFWRSYRRLGLPLCLCSSSMHTRMSKSPDGKCIRLFMAIVLVLVLVFDVPISTITAYSVTMASIHHSLQACRIESDHVSALLTYWLISLHLTFHPLIVYKKYHRRAIYERFFFSISVRSPCQSVSVTTKPTCGNTASTHA